MANQHNRIRELEKALRAESTSEEEYDPYSRSRSDVYRVLPKPGLKPTDFLPQFHPHDENSTKRLITLKQIALYQNGQSETVEKERQKLLFTKSLLSF